MSNSTLCHSGRWLAISVAVPLGICIATAGVMSIPPRRGSIDLIAGRDTFRAHCGGCHFAKMGFPAHQGPNLYEIGRTAATRKPGLSATDYILESILDPTAFVAPSSRPGMPRNVVANLSPDQVRNIVAFLASCGAFPDYDEIMRLEIPDMRREKEPVSVDLEQMLLARHVLREKARCFECHSRHSRPEYKVFAPGLFSVGLVDPTVINESIVHPNKEVLDTYQSVNVLLENGQTISGKLISETDDHLIVFTWDPSGKLVPREIPLAEVEEEDGTRLILKSEASPMPTGFGDNLTPEELKAVITLIQQLN